MVKILTNLFSLSLVFLLLNTHTTLLHSLYQEGKVAIESRAKGFAFQKPRLDGIQHINTKLGEKTQRGTARLPHSQARQKIPSLREESWVGEGWLGRNGWKS